MNWTCVIGFAVLGVGCGGQAINDRDDGIASSESDVAAAKDRHPHVLLLLDRHPAMYGSNQTAADNAWADMTSAVADLIGYSNTITTDATVSPFNFGLAFYPMNGISTAPAALEGETRRHGTTSTVPCATWSAPVVGFPSLGGKKTASAIADLASNNNDRILATMDIDNPVVAAGGKVPLRYALDYARQSLQTATAVHRYVVLVTNGDIVAGSPASTCDGATFGTGVCSVASASARVAGKGFRLSTIELGIRIVAPLSFVVS